MEIGVKQYSIFMFSLFFLFWS